MRISAVAVDAVFPAVGLFEADAEEADDGLVAHGGAILFCGFAHEPGRLESAASLTVGDEHGSAARCIAMVSSGLCAPLPLLGMELASGLIARISVFQRSMRLMRRCERQCDVGFARGVLRVGGAGEIEAGGGCESFRGSGRSSSRRSRPSG